jgi:hypothetical protein
VTGPYYWNKTAGWFPVQSGSPVLVDQQTFEDCCCAIEYGVDCTHCEAGRTPKYWTVTLSSVSPCTACVATGAYSSFKTTGLTINGTFLLTQVSTCVWRCTGGSFTAERYSDTTCGTKTNDITGSLRMTLTREAGGWVFRITGDFFDEAFFVFFEATSSETSDDDCLNIAAMSNTTTCGFAGGWLYSASGGTATFDAGDQT